MKKINYLIAIAIAAFTFTSCEDVPEPFGQPINPNAKEEAVATGDGSLENPFNALAAANEAKKLANGEVSEKAYYIKGKVSEIATDKNGVPQNFNSGYGNAQFYISDDGTSKLFYCYRVLYLGNKKWEEGDGDILKVGDDIIVYSKLTMYNDVAETPQNAGYLYSLNGKTEAAGGGGGSDTPSETIGTKDAPITVAKALEYIAALEDNGTTDKNAYVEGTIKQIKTSDENIAKFKNIDYIITDGTNDITVFRGKNLDNTDFTAAGQINVGDKVVVLGKLTKYVKDSNTTPEIAQGNYIVSLVKAGSGGDTPTSKYGTAEAPLTVAQAMALIDAESTIDEAFVKGKISQIDSYNSKYKSITYWISDDGGTTTQLQVYSGKGLDGADFAAKEDLTVGQTVTIKGTLKKFNETYEFDKTSSIVSIGDGGSSTSKYGTAEAPLTVAQAMALIDAESTIDEAFVKGKISQIDSYNSKYKSITYWISDDGTTTTQLQVYSGKGLDGADFAAKEDLTVGKTVTIKGTLKKFNETYEFDKTSSILSIQ